MRRFGIAGQNEKKHGCKKDKKEVMKFQDNMET
jgi:hypothetical protein